VIQIFEISGKMNKVCYLMVLNETAHKLLTGFFTGILQQ